jgi:hypothetical protein
MKPTPTLKIKNILPIYSFGGSFDIFPRGYAGFCGLGHEFFKK